jgi:hypothetical protein
LLGLIFLVVPWDRLPPRAVVLIAPAAALSAVVSDMTEHH